MHLRIVFLAVSGVRIYNERLRRHGVTLPGFVERAQVIASMPSLGLLTLAGATPPHHELRYVECAELDPDGRELARTLDADLVAISSFTAKSDVMYAIADQLRARGIKVALGGLHVTLVPDEAAQHADAIVVGEGELCWPRLVADAEAGRLRPRYAPASAREVRLGDVLPRYDLLEPDRYDRLPVQTTRGCPLHCEFCAASRIFGAYKRKPLEAVDRELAAVTRLWPRAFVELADDNTFVDKKHGRDLVSVIAKHDVRWFTETDVSIADDPVLLDALADSGCRQVLIGFESPRAGGLHRLDAANWKLRRFGSYERAIDAIQARGIAVNGCFITGLDADTPDVFVDIERFVQRSGLADVQVTVLTPFPGTALYARLRDEGRLLRETFWDQCTLFDVTFRPKNMTVDDLERGLEYLMGTLYTEPQAAARRRGFMRRARQGLREVA